MPCEQKVERIASLINPHLRFGSVAEAQAIVDSYRHTSSPVARQVQSKAEHFLSVVNGIEKLFGSRQETETKLSLIREAIRLSAREYLEQQSRRAPRKTGVYA